MARVLNLADVFQLIVHTLDQRPLPEQKLFEDRHQFVFHIAFEFGDQLHAFPPQLLEQLLPKVASIAKQFAPELADEFGHRTTVIDLSRGKREAEYFALVIDHQVQFEAIEPAPAAFPALGESGKDFVRGNAAVMTDPKGKTINELNTG